MSFHCRFALSLCFGLLSCSAALPLLAQVPALPDKESPPPIPADTATRSVDAALPPLPSPDAQPALDKKEIEKLLSGDALPPLAPPVVAPKPVGAVPDVPSSPSAPAATAPKAPAAEPALALPPVVIPEPKKAADSGADLFAIPALPAPALPVAEAPKKQEAPAAEKKAAKKNEKESKPTEKAPKLATPSPAQPSVSSAPVAAPVLPVAQDTPPALPALDAVTDTPPALPEAPKPPANAKTQAAEKTSTKKEDKAETAAPDQESSKEAPSKEESGTKKKNKSKKNTSDRSMQTRRGGSLDANYQTQTLPEAIYKHDYDPANKHLPRAVYYSDYEQQFFAAIARGDAAAVRAFLDKGVDSSVRNPAGDTALLYAVRNQRLSMVPLLLGRSSKTNETDNDGASPLHLAVMLNNTSIASALLAGGINLENTDVEGRTALHIAVNAGMIPMVKTLLGGRVSPNTPLSNGQTPLHIAAARGNTSIVELLLRYRALTGLRDMQGLSAQDYARYYGHGALAERLMPMAGEVGGGKAPVPSFKPPVQVRDSGAFYAPQPLGMQPYIPQATPMSSVEQPPVSPAITTTTVFGNKVMVEHQYPTSGR